MGSGWSGWSAMTVEQHVRRRGRGWRLRCCVLLLAKKVVVATEERRRRRLMLLSIRNCKYGTIVIGRILGDDIFAGCCVYVQTNGWGRIYFLAGRTTWII